MISLIALLFVAAAEPAAGPEVKPADRFAYEYMGCDEELMNARLKSKAISECEADVSRKYCKAFFALPVDAQDTIDQTIHCHFLAGEQSGDPEQDKQSQQYIDENCKTVDSDQLDLAKKYVDNAAVLRDVLTLEDNYERDFYDNCPGTPPEGVQ